MERAGVPLPPVYIEMARDDYYHAGFQVSYDASGIVEYIELYRGEPFLARYLGVDVFTMPADELVAFIAQRAPYDPDDPSLGFSYLFHSLDLALWRPVLPEDCEEEDEPDEYDCGRVFTTIGVGRRGYFES